MREIELKFRIPPERRAALKKSLATPSAERQILQATYYDTADRSLAKRRVALRLRREGRRWVQTAKAAGPDPMSRLEHEVDLGGRRPPPEFRPDPARHASHPALHQALVEALAAASGPLEPVFSTHIERTRRVLRASGARVELALDEGEIEAGSAALPVSEIEFELLDGSVTGLLALARSWARRHHLWLDARSKAERGEHLAQGSPVVSAARVVAPTLSPQLHPAQALALGLQSALGAWLANAAELADSAEGRADCVHQLRVALRRLRVLLAVFGDWLPEPPPARGSRQAVSSLEAPLDEQLATLFRDLGRQRDQDVLSALIGGPLHAGGYSLPPLQGPADPWGTVAASVRSVAFTDAALRLLQRIASADTLVAQGLTADPGSDSPWPDGDAGRSESAARPVSHRLRRRAGQALQREWKRFCRDARDFAALEHEQQHKVRKRAKRLRYALDFCQSLFPAGRVRRFLEALADAQDALGTYTDVLMGQEHLRRRPLDDAAAAFARGWLSARREVTLQACERPLRRLLKTSPPWD